MAIRDLFKNVAKEPETEIIEDKERMSVCANCGNVYIGGDRYCRFCGAPMGKPKFIMQEFACIYGPPPVKRVHKCVKCGFTWETCSMVDRQEFCPRCGGDAPYTEAE